MKVGESGRFEEIDVLRGVAAVAVVVFHYAGHCLKVFGDFPFDFRIGARGVELFFLVSGFVIYFTLKRSRSLWDFAFSRFSRLYPVYWGTLTLVIFIDVTVFDKKMWWGGYIVNMTMLQKFVGFPDIDTVFWSLAVELAFYVIMCALLATGLLKKIVWVCLIWLVIASAWVIATRVYGIELSGAFATYLILPYVPYFIAGIMFYLISAEGANPERVLIIICCLAVEWLVNGREMMLIALALFTVFALAINGALRGCVLSVTVWLGAISYPLYLVHRELGYQVLFKLHALGVPSLISFVITLIGALVLASIMCYGVERPAMRALRQWHRKSTVKSDIALSAGI